MTSTRIMVGVAMTVIFGCGGATAPIDEPSDGTKIVGDSASCAGQLIPELGCATGQAEARCEAGRWRLTCPTPTGSGECSSSECGPAPGMPTQFCYDGTSAGHGACSRGSDGRCGYSFTSCPNPDGTYGGPHAELKLAANGDSFVQFDCGEGSFGWFLFQSAGTFTSEGTYTAGSGIQTPAPPKPVKATYTGTFSGKTHLQLKMQVDGSPDSTIFELERGQPSVLMRCL